eukprot:1212964-Pleurochrysis_carterae.AAC.2
MSYGSTFARVHAMTRLEVSSKYCISVHRCVQAGMCPLKRVNTNVRTPLYRLVLGPSTRVRAPMNARQTCAHYRVAHVNELKLTQGAAPAALTACLALLHACLQLRAWMHTSGCACTGATRTPARTTRGSHTPLLAAGRAGSPWGTGRTSAGTRALRAVVLGVALAMVVKAVALVPAASLMNAKGRSHYNADADYMQKKATLTRSKV